MPAEGKETPGVLFVCVHNAGRSQMAAGLLRHLAENRAKVFSAGSKPANELNPLAIEAMAEIGIDISQNFPMLFDESLMEEVDIVVTMGCGDTCPILPGKNYLDWQLDDPADQKIEKVRTIRDQIENKVRLLIEEIL
ncbi:MAG: arsenate reductase ArsC [Actinomycetota bacterium]|nr:heat-shock protein HtpX [Dehalococcoidia bacterium]MEC7909780.1 arsenate reductase ArsC [Actinomycetota bacterium]|tara:strand:+ start:163 stop:573 length:411 start_codon:yes stop_codon:yes gene_type:complete